MYQWVESRQSRTTLEQGGTTASWRAMAHFRNLRSGDSPQYQFGMARSWRSLLVAGLVGGALLASVSSRPTITAQAAPVGVLVVADDDEDTAVPSDMLPEPASEMPSDSASDNPTDLPADMTGDDSSVIATETPTATPAATATPTVTATVTPTASPTPNPIIAIQQVIQHSNDEQVQAVATRNLSLIADTVTDDHFQELASILQDMLNHKLNSIALLKLDWGPIVVAADGNSAVATTYETWRIVSQEGSIDDAPQRNDYTLVRANGTWKIKSDVQTVAPTQPPGTAVPSQ